MKKKLLLAGIIAIVFFIFGLLFENWLEIDKCLDNGGRWDYKNKDCVHQ
jgi:hypothetical protein